MKESLVRVGEYIVVEDKLEGSSYVKLLPLASSTRISSSWNTNNKVSLPNGKEIDASDTIEAIWLSTNSNRRTAPDVTAGSTVTAYKDPRGNTYYWTEDQTQLNYRKLEEVTYSWSNRPEGNKSPEDLPLQLCTYNITISTMNKLVRLDTANNDGEAAKYTFNLDTKEGIFSIQDDLGNLKRLKSVEGDETTVRKTNIANNAPNFINLIDKTTTEYNMGSEVKLYDKDVTHEISGKHQVKAKESILDVATMKQHIGKLETKVGEFIIAVEKSLKVNSLKVGSTSASSEPLEIDKFNEAKDAVLEHFQAILDESKNPNTDEEEEEKREKVESEKNDSVSDGKKEFEVDIDTAIKIITTSTIEIKATTKSLGALLLKIQNILDMMNKALSTDAKVIQSVAGVSAYMPIGETLNTDLPLFKTDIENNFK